LSEKGLKQKKPGKTIRKWRREEVEDDEETSKKWKSEETDNIYRNTALNREG